MADTYGEGNFQYTFVDDWLKLPEGYKLLECPGVAVDGEDRVFILTRGEHPYIIAPPMIPFWPLTTGSIPSKNSVRPVKS